MKVIPGLYVGNYRDSKDIVQLGQHGITHILAIHDTARKLFSNREYLLIAASDVPSQNLTQYFHDCNDFIHSARLKGGQVLIHCLAGMSRSVTVAVAYLMSVTNLGWREALQAIRGARPVANPNYGFQKQLQDYEIGKLQEERRRINETYGREKSQEDETYCRKLITTYRKAAKYGHIPEAFCNKSRSHSARKSCNSSQYQTKSPKKVCGNLKQRTLSITSLPCQLPSAKTKEDLRLSSTELCSRQHSLSCSSGLSQSLPSSPRAVCRRCSEPNIQVKSGAHRLVRSESLPLLLSPRRQQGGSKTSQMKATPTGSLPVLGASYPLALPEVTHAYESEDGTDPLGTDSPSVPGIFKMSLARSYMTQLSQFSLTHMTRLSRSLKAWRTIRGGIVKQSNT